MSHVAAYEDLMGFVPDTVLTMARVPGLVEACVGLGLASAMNGLVSEELAQLAGHMASAGAGCRYCQARTVAHAEHLGVPPQKLEALWSFETSDLYTEAEPLGSAQRLLEPQGWDVGKHT